ncbi:hypothetical protein O9993_09825 [Vibrio lentus]|nr:hypothetical protein [Vibrio lentus]
MFLVMITQKMVNRSKRAGFGNITFEAVYTPTFAKDSEMNLGVDNLFDKKYAEHTGFGISWGSDKYQLRSRS